MISGKQINQINLSEISWKYRRAVLTLVQGYFFVLHNFGQNPKKRQFRLGEFVDGADALRAPFQHVQDMFVVEIQLKVNQRIFLLNEISDVLNYLLAFYWIFKLIGELISVEIIEQVWVEPRRVAVDSFDIKLFRQLLHVVADKSFAGIPCEATSCLCNVVDECQWKNSLVPIIFQFDVVLSFAQFASISVHDQWEMGELGRVPAQSSVKHQVLRSADLPLNAAQNMTDLHQMIIDDIGEVISWKSIRLEDHWIAFVLRYVINGASIDHVIERLASVAQLESDAIFVVF